MQFVMIFSLILAVLAVVFALQNTAMVTLSFFIWTFNSPLALLLLIALTIGAIITSILTLPGWVKNKRSSSVHRKEVAGMEESLAKYRTDLIDTQNKNKDLRQKIIEVEEAKEALEKAQEKALHEVEDLRTALGKSKLTAEEAEIARKEAIDARNQMDQALKEMDQRLASVSQESENAGKSVTEFESLTEEEAAAEASPDQLETDAADVLPAEPQVHGDENNGEHSAEPETPESEEEQRPHHFW